MPNNKAKSRFVSRSKTFSRVASIIVILIGALVFLGWLFDISELKNIYGGITMKSNTARLVDINRSAAAKVGMCFDSRDVTRTPPQTETAFPPSRDM